MRVRTRQDDITRIVDRYIRALDGAGPQMDTAAFQQLEREFVAARSQFSRMHGISDGAWMDAGVSPVVLVRT